MPVKPLAVKPAGSGVMAHDALSHMNDWAIPTTPQEKMDWAWEHPIYIYNVSDHRFIRHMGGLGPYTIFPCEVGERYSRPTIVPRIVQETIPVDIRKMEIRDNSGLELAQNILGIAGFQPKDQSIERWGIFISHSNPPLPEEVEAAEAILMQTSHKLVQEADGFYNDGPAEHKNITANHRKALALTKQKRPWAVASIEMSQCPGCMEPIAPGVVVHTCGAVLNWDKAIELGIKKESDRPAPAEPKKKA
jgi:hypothetical protein